LKNTIKLFKKPLGYFLNFLNIKKTSMHPVLHTPPFNYLQLMHLTTQFAKLIIILVFLLNLGVASESSDEDQPIPRFSKMGGTHTKPFYQGENSNGS
jgi:hypothetical protein